MKRFRPVFRPARAAPPLPNSFPLYPTPFSSAQTVHSGRFPFFIRIWCCASSISLFFPALIFRYLGGIFLMFVGPFLPFLRFPPRLLRLLITPPGLKTRYWSTLYSLFSDFFPFPQQSFFCQWVLSRQVSDPRLFAVICPLFFRIFLHIPVPLPLGLCTSWR